MAGRTKEVRGKIDVEDLIHHLKKVACHGEVSYVIPGFPGEMHLKECTGAAPDIGQRVLVIPIDDSPMETSEVPL